MRRRKAQEEGAVARLAIDLDVLFRTSKLFLKILNLLTAPFIKYVQYLTDCNN